MKRALAVGVIGLVLGGVLGAMAQQRSIRQRQSTLAVMWLSQFHLDGLQKAVRRGDCAAAAQSADRLHMLADELPWVLPLATEQDADFRDYVEHYRKATSPAAQAGACTYDSAMLKRVRDACADCHRDYR